MTSTSAAEKSENASSDPFREALALSVAAILCCLQAEWLRRINSIVPDSYLDEVFHVPQANAYWQGRWSHWDDKITTPPGLYAYSVALIRGSWAASLPPSFLEPAQLRWTNTILLYILAAACTTWLLLHKNASIAQLLTQSLAIFSFPLFFFFSGLYYTDIFAAVTVMTTYSLWEAARSRHGLTAFLLQVSQVISGVIALTARQTNIFWVGIFLGGLQVIDTTKSRTRIHDPDLVDAYFEDHATMTISLVSSAIPLLPQLLRDLWPQLSLLTTFAAFVVWNGGVVLGDKSNHVAGIHVTQILYLFTFMFFMSWPMLLPQLTSLGRLSRSIPRIWLISGSFILATAIVHFNSPIHPFLLADNRHYTFYLFKALRTQPWKFYAAVPVYLISTWACCMSLCSCATESFSQVSESRSDTKLDSQRSVAESNTTSFLLVWLVSSGLSLATAPLVEFRYFILPWLMWRLRIPDSSEILKHEEPRRSERRTMPAFLGTMTSFLATNSAWIEIAWFTIINLVTGAIFLYRGFTWPQEADQIQRFMW